MRPQPAASMSGTAACTQWNVPVRFTASMRSHDSSGDVGERLEAVDARARDHDLDGAELGSHRASAASTAPRSLTSTDTAIVVAPLDCRSFAHCSAASPSTSSTATRRPCSARRRQIAAPMPAAPPVTTATLLMRLRPPALERPHDLRRPSGPPDLRLDAHAAPTSGPRTPARPFVDRPGLRICAWMLMRLRPPALARCKPALAMRKYHCHLRRRPDA